jgi:hypothetical protein
MVARGVAISSVDLQRSAGLVRVDAELVSTDLLRNDETCT